MILNSDRQGGLKKIVNHIFKRKIKKIWNLDIHDTAKNVMDKQKYTHSRE
jgi:hypothetical protein